MMDQLNLSWVAWEAESAGGYAHIAEKFHFHLRNDGRINFVNAYNGVWDALICVATPARWILGRNLAPRPDIVFHTMFEATPLPPGWAESMNCAGLIWAPSQWVKEMFIDSGVTAPIFVTGYGVNHLEYEEVDRSGRSDPMKFLIWADTLFSRKNVTKAVKAFIDAGLPDAELEVKLHSFAGMNPGTIFTDGKGRPLANVSLHMGAWPRKRINRWLQSGDCGIYPSGGEGFGLMPLESMKTGLPMICANNTGMMEYLKPGNHIPVASKGLVKSPTYSLNYSYEAYVYDIDYDQLVEQIRWAYYHREEAYAIGRAGTEEADRWDWAEQTNKATNILLEHYGISVVS